MYSIDEHHGKHIIMTLSKKEAFLNNNAILRKELEDHHSLWTVTFARLVFLAPRHQDAS